jgi:twitching motility protein PilT
VRQLNETSPWRRYISMLEQPIRVLQPDGKCSIVQREVGVDTKDFASGFSSALEHDADVIVLACDLSDDPALLDMALHAAESGKLVIGKMSAPDVSSTFQALFARAQSGAQADMRVRVAGAVRGVLSQRLLRRADGLGRVAVVEAYLSSPELQRMLLDPGSFLDVREALAAARPLLGTQTFDQHLGDLVQDGVISIDVAMGLAVHPADLRQRHRPAKNA